MCVLCVLCRLCVLCQMNRALGAETCDVGVRAGWWQPPLEEATYPAALDGQ